MPSPEFCDVVLLLTDNLKLGIFGIEMTAEPDRELLRALAELVAGSCGAGAIFRKLEDEDEDWKSITGGDEGSSKRLKSVTKDCSQFMNPSRRFVSSSEHCNINTEFFLNNASKFTVVFLYAFLSYTYK